MRVNNLSAFKPKSEPGSIVALGNETLNFLPSILPYAAFSEILVSQIVTKGGKNMLARIKKFEDELSEMGAYIRPNQ